VSTEVTIVCDNCAAELTGGEQAYRIQLTSFMVETRDSMTRGFDPVPWPRDFCDLPCLAEWIDRGGPRPEQPAPCAECHGQATLTRPAPDRASLRYRCKGCGKWSSDPAKATR